MQTFNLPKHSKVIYLLNAETKYYLQTQIEAQQTAIDRLPMEMRLAPAKAENVAINADKLLLSRECKNGKYRFITGLQETSFENWYLANDYEYIRGQKVLSLILVHFTNEAKELELYYFHRYDKRTTILRHGFATDAIPHLLKRAA